MGVRVTNAAPAGHLVRHTAGIAGSGVACFSGERTVREIRKHYVNVRFSEKEFEKLNTQMHLSGYNNRSRYIRETLLSTRLRVRRNLSRNEANVAKQIELLRTDLKRIGVNYNQRVKTLNRLAILRDKQGHSIVNARDIEHDMTEMKRMMEAMVKTVATIETEVLGEDEEEKS